jgi:hypothetical protein
MKKFTINIGSNESFITFLNQQNVSYEILSDGIYTIILEDDTQLFNLSFLFGFTLGCK